MSAGSAPSADGAAGHGWLFGVIRAARRRQRRRRLIVAAMAAAVLGGLVVLLLVVRGAAPGGSGPVPHADRAAGGARSSAPQPALAAPTLGWRLAHQTDVNPGSGLRFVSARVGFALSGQPLNSLDGGLSAPDGLTIAWPSPTVLVTRDGGRHWRSLLSALTGFWGIQFHGTDDGWAVGVTGLYRTVDAGRRWRKVGEPTGALVRVAFANASGGYGLTADGRLVMTGDGGASWHASDWHRSGAAVCATSGGTFLLADQSAGLWRSGPGAWARVAAARSRVRGFSPWWTDLSCQGQYVVALDLAYCEAACGGGVVARARQSTDGGRTWKPIVTTFGELGAGPRSAIIERAAAVGSESACLVEESIAGEVGLRCGQSGHTEPAVVPPAPFRGRYNSVVVQGLGFDDAITGWLLLDQTTAAASPAQARTQTQVWTTHDRGRTWQITYRGPIHAPIAPGA